MLSASALTNWNIGFFGMYSLQFFFVPAMVSAKSFIVGLIEKDFEIVKTQKNFCIAFPVPLTPSFLRLDKLPNLCYSIGDENEL